MNHIFVVNPHAGRRDSTAQITRRVEQYAAEHPQFQYLIYHTQSPGDATTWVRQYCESHPEQQLRFYACGGDGTLNEVLSGIIGHTNAQLSCLASGSGNDFIKYYGTHDDFNNLPRLIEGVTHPVDVMRVTSPHSDLQRYSINVCNFGFDAQVVRTMERVRRFPIIGGKQAYTTGIVASLFTGMRNHIALQVDGKPFFDGVMLLCALSNGRYYGGNYNCAPHSFNDDGLIEIGLFRRMSVITLARLIGSYTRGTHLQHPAAQRYILQGQGVHLSLSSNSPFWISVDGELIQGSRFEIQNLHHAITFVSPA